MSSVEMVRIGDYCTVVKGKIGIKKAVEGNFPLVTTAEERLSHNEYHFDKPSVIIPVVSSTGHGHASLKRIHYQEGHFSVGSILAVLTPKDQRVVSANFLYHYLDTYKEQLLVSQMKGMANVTLSIKAIENVEFPLMSPEQQLEWVKLFSKTKKYKGSLSSEITHQQTLLKKLRQQILQDAIAGKLTAKWREENPDIEPASELINRIKLEKEKLVKEKLIKKQKPIPPISDDEIPFDLPSGWCWCRGDLIADYIDPQPSHRTPPVSKDNVPYVAMKDISNDRIINFSTSRMVSKEVLEEHRQRYTLHKGDFIFGKIGTIGNPVWLPEPFNYTLSANLILIQANREVIDPEYLFAFLSSPLAGKFLIDQRSTMSYPVFGMKKARLMLVPLPPIEEGLVIVERIKEIDSICIGLESQATKSQREAELLIQAVLNEAFEDKL